ncbi:MAG: ABC transporter ATP-binding protein [Microbacterium sp.]|uniref:ABC transporter ATP-binding protein n=1 Tax=Microbacterium sp. TaxID=51671 RepID=UPI0039E250DE
MSPIERRSLLDVDQLVLEVAGVRVGPVSFRLGVGESLGIVGESGSGKSLLCRTLTGMLGQHGGSIVSGRLRFDGVALERASIHDWRDVRRGGIAFMPQASLSGLNPFRRVGTHFKEVFDSTPSFDGNWRDHALRLLDRVRLRDPEQVLAQYGHQLSGGMQQRVLLALALANGPRLLVADEPTTALDATVATEVLELLRELRDVDGLALIVVSHDLAVIRRVCARTSVMYAGRFIETARTSSLLAAAAHPYTRGLIASDPTTVPFGQPIVPIPGESLPPAGWHRSRCPFIDRCAHAAPACEVGTPPLVPVGEEHEAACVRWREVAEAS